MEHTILGAIEDNALEDGEHAVGINTDAIDYLEVGVQAATIQADANDNAYTVEEEDFLEEVDFTQQPKTHTVDQFQNLTNEIAAEADGNRNRFAMYTYLIRESNNRIDNAMYIMSESNKRVKAFEDQLLLMEQEAERSRKFFRNLSDKVDRSTEALDKRIGNVQDVVTSISFRVDELCRTREVEPTASSMIDVARVMEKSNDRVLEHVISSVQHIATHVNTKLKESEERVLSDVPSRKNEFPGVPEHRSVGMPESRSTGVPECWSHGTLEHRNTGEPEC